MEINLQGFHGTSFENAKNIVIQNFELSIGDGEWIGDGVYFFLNGLSSDPKEQAKKWAIAQAWDNETRDYKYKNISVIRCDIEVDSENFLDLTTSDGIELFDYIIEQHTQN